MPLIQYPWRAQMQPASFRGCGFHVEVDTLSGGRRIALHEYPKRDIPYAEDMGRRAQRHTIEGYLIGPDYITFRDNLRNALELEGPGQLVHPFLGTFQVSVDQYSVTESRERGGYCIFSMLFVEAGQPVNYIQGATNTAANVVSAAQTSDAAAASSLNISVQDVQKAVAGQ